MGSMPGRSPVLYPYFTNKNDGKRLILVRYTLQQYVSRDYNGTWLEHCLLHGIWMYNNHHDDKMFARVRARKYHLKTTRQDKLMLDNSLTDETSCEISSLVFIIFARAVYRHSTIYIYIYMSVPFLLDTTYNKVKDAISSLIIWWCQRKIRL